MSHASNQLPVTVTHVDLQTGETIVETTEPTTALDGGDGTRAAEATKTADDVYHPMRPLSDSTQFQAAPATRIKTTGDDTATIAAGLAKV